MAPVTQKKNPGKKTPGKDTGSPGVQAAFLTERINRLQAKHLSVHDTDHASRRGLLKMVSKRTSLLRYMARKDPKGHAALIQKLGLRK